MSTAISLGPVPSDSLIVILSRESGDSYLVHSVQMVSGGMRNSHCFFPGRAVENTFVPEFSRSFLAILSKLGVDAVSFDEPAFSFSLPGIGISGLRIDPSQQGDPPNMMRLRFRRYVGDVTRILRYEQSVELPSATVRERIAVEVLRDIVTPIFDILSLSKSTSREVVQHHSAAIEARLDRLSIQQEEIEFYTGLLKRYVAGCQQDVVDSDESAGNASNSLTRRARH